MKDLMGMKFGRLVVVKHMGRTKSRQQLWLCRCDCGKKKIVQGSNLTNGNTKSCGCLNKELVKRRNVSNKKHGQCNHKLYKIWSGMKRRCYYNKHTNFHNYGARGITICKEWLSDFTAFYNWALNNGYKEGLTIDRIDVNGNYEPTNCKWSTSIEQHNNTRSNTIIIYDGKSQSMADLARQYGVDYNLFVQRINRGWNIKRALKTKKRMEETRNVR